MAQQAIYNQPLNADPNYANFASPSPQPGQPEYRQPGYPQVNYPQLGHPQQGYAQPVYPQVEYPQQPGYSPNYQQPLNPQPSPQYAATPDYNYDPSNIEYRPITVDNWAEIPADQSPYSQFWESPNSFKPQTFSSNTKFPRKCNDVFWLIAFWINFVVTVAIIIYLAVVAIDSYKDHQEDTTTPLPDSSQSDIYDFSSTDMMKCLLYSLIIAFSFNLIHFCWVTYASSCYLKSGLIVNAIISIGISLIPVIQGYYAFLIYPAISILLIIIVYCIMWPYIKLSAAILKTSSKITCSYPSLFFLIVLQSIWQVIIGFAFTFAFYFVILADISYGLYVYLIFSYLWIIITFGYVVYMTGAGLAASWYFLYNTQYFPSSPVWESYKRSMTTSFGSASFAAFLVAVVQTLRTVIEHADTPSDTNSTIKCIITILKCIALCILNLIESCLKFINRYALIYCSVFGVPFKEGCRRWAELNVHKFVDVLMSGNCIGTALTGNGAILIAGSAVLGYAIGLLVFNGSLDLHYGKIFLCVFSLLLTLAIFAVMTQPITTIADTLLVCFAEEPEALKTSSNELYEELKSFYGEQLTRRVHH